MNLNQTIDGVVVTMQYIKDNQLKTIPQEPRKVLDYTAMAVMMAKVGVIDKSDVILTIKAHWDTVDNYLVHEMGYEPLTHVSSFNKQDDIAKFVGQFFPNSGQELGDFLESLDHDEIDVLVDDLDAFLWEHIATWFVEKMTGPEDDNSSEGDSNRPVSSDEDLPMFILYMGD